MRPFIVADKKLEAKFVEKDEKIEVRPDHKVTWTSKKHVKRVPVHPLICSRELRYSLVGDLMSDILQICLL